MININELINLLDIDFIKANALLVDKGYQAIERSSDVYSDGNIYDDSKDEVSDLENEVSNLKDEVSNLEDEISNLENEVSDLENEVSDLEDEVSDLKKQIK